MTTTLPARSGPIHQLLNPSIHTVVDRLDIRTNQRVLEIGASGEITARLAELVGRYGSVTAVDADTSHLTGTAVIDVQQRDPATSCPARPTGTTTSSPAGPTAPCATRQTSSST